MALPEIPKPEPGKRAPHQDLGILVDVLISNAEGVGEAIMGVLDKPFEATIKIRGPHRLVDNLLDTGAETVRSILKKLSA